MKQTTFIENVATKIQALGLATPAILLLEAHKPLSFLGSHLLLIAQPTLNIFLPRDLTQHSINLLADPHQLERLITRLENGPPANLSGPSTPVAEGRE